MVDPLSYFLFHECQLHGKSVRSWCDGSSDLSSMVDPLSYFLPSLFICIMYHFHHLHANEGRRKEMFYLMTHSTHFIYGYYGVRHMVKGHSDSERGNPLLSHKLLFLISSKGSFIGTIPQTG